MSSESAAASMDIGQAPAGEMADRPGRSPVIETAAAAMLQPGMRGRPSPFDASTVTWTEDAAADIVTRVRDNPDMGDRTFVQKLQEQLVGAPRATILLTGELLALQSLPLSNVYGPAKRARVESVLGLLPDRPAIPAVLESAWDDDREHGPNGVFHGGTSFNTRVWMHLIWLAGFVRRWTALEPAEQQQALADPLAFGRFLGASPDNEAAIRQALSYLVHPDFYEAIPSEGHRRRIRDAFADRIGGSTGDDALALNSDLHRIRESLQAESSAPVYWYYPELRSRWDPEAAKPGAQRAWLVRPDKAEIQPRWLDEGFVSLPATHLPDVEPGSTLQVVKAAVDENYAAQDYQTRGRLGQEYHAFLSSMASGDLVIVLDGSTDHIGLVGAEPEYGDEPGQRLTRPVEWLASVDHDSLPPPIPGLVKLQGSIVEITKGIDAIREALAAHECDEVDTPRPNDSVAEDSPTSRQAPGGKPSLPPVPAELSSRLHVDRDWLQEVVELLESRGQIVLYGPPGTGKTFLALAMADHVVGSGHGDRIRKVQFHPSYAYEDFIEGFRPSRTDAGDATFELVAGPLRRIASEAAEHPEAPYVLIIDELNRANLAKVFGELYFLLEYRDEFVDLQYQPETHFSLPPNLFIIGTMNTADRSIALLDAAMRRRFSFVELHPDEPPIRDLLANWQQANELDDGRPQLLAELNAAIEDQDRDLRIGPSYLMRAEAASEPGLARVWRYDILPLLEEHYYGRLTRDEVQRRFGLDALRAAIAARTGGEAEGGGDSSGSRGVGGGSGTPTDADPGSEVLGATDTHPDE